MHASSHPSRGVPSSEIDRLVGATSSGGGGSSSSLSMPPFSVASPPSLSPGGYASSYADRPSRWGLSSVGEWVNWSPHNPHNQWNSAAAPFRGILFNLFLTVPLLYTAAIAVMAVMELYQSRSEHRWSFEVWWALQIASVTCLGVTSMASIFLDQQKQPLGQKNEQFYPPPPQDYRIVLLAFFFSFAGLGQMIYMESIKTEYLKNDLGAQDYTHDFKIVMMWTVVSAVTALRDIIMAIRIPVNWPVNKETPRETAL